MTEPLDQVVQALIKRLNQKPLFVKHHEGSRVLRFEGLQQAQVQRAMKGTQQVYLKRTPNAVSLIQGEWTNKKGSAHRYKFNLYVYKDGTQTFTVTNNFITVFVSLHAKPKLTKVANDEPKWENEFLALAFNGERKLAVRAEQGWIAFQDLHPRDLPVIKKMIGDATTPFDKALNKYFKD